MGMKFSRLARDNTKRLLESAKRFPLTLAFGAAGALAGATMALMRTEPEDSRLFFVLLACWLSVPVSFAFGLLEEAFDLRKGARAGLAAFALGLAGLAYALFSNTPDPDLPLRFVLWFAAALALVLSTPLFARHDTVRFRHFGLILLQRLLAT